MRHESAGRSKARSPSSHGFDVSAPDHRRREPRNPHHGVRQRGVGSASGPPLRRLGRVLAGLLEGQPPFSGGGSLLEPNERGSQKRGTWPGCDIRLNRGSFEHVLLQWLQFAGVLSLQPLPAVRGMHHFPAGSPRGAPPAL